MRCSKERFRSAGNRGKKEGWGRKKPVTSRTMVASQEDYSPDGKIRPPLKGTKLVISVKRRAHHGRTHSRVGKTKIDGKGEMTLKKAEKKRGGVAQPHVS